MVPTQELIPRIPAEVVDDEGASLPPILLGKATPAVQAEVRSFYLSVAEMLDRWIGARESQHTKITDIHEQNFTCEGTAKPRNVDTPRKSAYAIAVLFKNRNRGRFPGNMETSKTVTTPQIQPDCVPG